MVFAWKSKGGSERWGMGLLLVLLHEDHDSSINGENKKNHSSSPSSSISMKSLNGVIRPTASSNNLIASRAQSTISICALIVFVTLLVFTLCTFEPTLPNPQHHNSSRRWLSQKPTKPFHPKTETTRGTWGFLSSSRAFWARKSRNAPKPKSRSPASALQGLGTLFRRGTAIMSDLVIAHVPENITEEELRLFLRLLHRSGLTSRSDVALIFASITAPLGSVVQEENESFLKLVRRYIESGVPESKSGMKFEVGQFVKPSKREKEQKEPLWGKGGATHGDPNRGEVDESTRLIYGSVVGFEAAELDPENTLSGFLDHVPMSLRRWACYQMLLGRVRRNFKHVMLVDAKNSVVVRDPLGRVGGKSSESVYLWTERVRPGRKSPDSDRNRDPKPPLSAAVLMGGARGVRRFANAVLVEIVRAAIQRKGKNPVSESALLSQLARTGFVRSKVDLLTSAESITDASSAGKPNWGAWSSRGVVLRGTRNRDFSSAVMKHMCSHPHERSVYPDCLLQRA